MALWGHTELGTHCSRASLCTRVSHGSNVADFKPRGLSALAAVVQWARWETRLFTQHFSLIWIRPRWTWSQWLLVWIWRRRGVMVVGSERLEEKMLHMDKNDLGWTLRRKRARKGRKTNFHSTPTRSPLYTTPMMWLSREQNETPLKRQWNGDLIYLFLYFNTSPHYTCNFYSITLKQENDWNIRGVNFSIIHWTKLKT